MNTPIPLSTKQIINVIQSVIQADITHKKIFLYNGGNFGNFFSDLFAITNK